MKKTKNLLVLILLLSISIVSVAIPFQVSAGQAKIGKYTYINEIDYADTMDHIVMPCIQEIRSEGYIIGSDNVSLHYEKFITSNAKDSIVIFHGISEASEKFYEFIYDLTCNNYNVYLLEHRGHGNSGRFIDNPSKIDVDNWEYYISDQKLFVDTIVKPELQDDSKLYLYAHSMGGLIGTAYLEKYTDDFDAAVINCPLYNYEIGIPNIIFNAGTSFLTMIGKGEEYAPGLGDFCEEVKLEYALSSSLERMYYYNDQRVKDVSQHLYSGTNHFYSQTFKMINYATKKKNVEKIDCPVLLVTGLKDGAVSIDKQTQIATYSDKITQITFSNANHELYMESDEILAPYLESILNYYSAI